MGRMTAISSDRAVTGTVHVMGGVVTHIESAMEMYGLATALARADARRVAVQLGPYFYSRDANRRRHFFDAGVWLADGTLHLFAVKPKRSSRYAELVEILKRLAQDDPRLADAHLHVVTEDHIAPWQVQRAGIINRALDRPDDEADEIAMNCIANADGPIRIADVDLDTGLGHRCLSAVARLIAHGVVAIPHGVRLDTDAFVHAVDREPVH